MPATMTRKKKSAKKATKKVDKAAIKAKTAALKAKAKEKAQAEKLETKRVSTIVKMAARKCGVTRQEAIDKLGISYGQGLRLFKKSGVVCTGARGKAKIFTSKK